MRTRHLVFVAAALAVIAACGSSETDGSSSGGGSSSSGGSSTSSSTGSTSSSGSSGSSGGGSTSDCFATAAGVTTGTPCAPEGKFCEYGCNDTATCTKGAWVRRQTEIACPPNLPQGCPAALTDVPKGSPCTTHGLTCIYPTGTCACVTPGGLVGLDGGSPDKWACGPDPGCPTPRPHLGASCSTPGQSCTYVAPDCGPTRMPEGEAQVCKDGYWQPTQLACAG
jgi:hypothetical protein